MTRNDSIWKFFYPNKTFDKTINKIKSFNSLENGWRYGEGVCPNADIIDKAIELIQKSIESGLYKTDAIPQADGGIELIISQNNAALEIHLEPDNTITYYKMRDNVDIEQQDLINIEDLKFKIRQFWNETCLPSGSSNSENIASIGQGFQAPLSAHPQRMEVFPSSTGTVYLDAQERISMEMLTGT